MSVITKEDVTSGQTDAFANFIFKSLTEDPVLYESLAEELKWMMITLYPAKKTVTTRLGKQAFCIDLTHRNWVWTGDDWALFVSKTGATFEVRAGLSLIAAVKTWNDFLVKADLKDTKRLRDEYLAQRARGER